MSNEEAEYRMELVYALVNSVDEWLEKQKETEIHERHAILVQVLIDYLLLTCMHVGCEKAHTLSCLEESWDSLYDEFMKGKANERT